ncbi:hypothetical protein FV226_23210 [Methylobacterium sp. WL12]|uniref:hypothetical protein n=1 Tax=Methylobacterium sp. WL12 TaxID=2603890 RepID=UPI0011C8CD2F|nr:hypothetical protein [Methylobacterium sp. WL12]TXM66635.1 hypothetical protein FV226_23210 [Methylobacterium sp. WL12]
MCRPTIPASQVPTTGPWLVRFKANHRASHIKQAFWVEAATDDRVGDGPYLILQDRTFAPGETPLQLALAIQRLADARLIAIAPDLAAALFWLLTSPALTRHDLDPRTREAQDAAWQLLVWVTPHLEIGS